VSRQLICGFLCDEPLDRSVVAPLLCLPPQCGSLMQIRSLAIRNFRSCEEMEVAIDRITAIVGANGCGKSAVLRALDLFYASVPKFGPDDFFAHDTTREIEITVTFEKLTSAERKSFAVYLVRDELSVTRVFYWREGRGGNRLHGSRPRYEGFDEIRSGKSAAEKKAAYGRVRANGTVELPAWSNADESLAALADWEGTHPDSCKRSRDDGNFFGFKEVGQGYLGRSTRLLFIPAVRDASTDAQDGKGSVISELMDLVVRRTIADNPEYKKLVEETRTRYLEVFDTTKFKAVGTLSARLTETLKTYVPNAAVGVSWETSDVDLPLPRASIRVAEDGFSTNIAGCGHGLQRAFILTLLQHLAAAQPMVAGPVETGEEPVATTGAAQSESIPGLILVIEEPELFQHPSRQRHFAEVLQRLSQGTIPGVASGAQVIYCTHSPHFVGIDRFDQVRIFRKAPHEQAGYPQTTRVSHATLNKIASRLAAARGHPHSPDDAEGLRARLAPVMTPATSEGFFADVAVLVEGESDRAAILAVSEMLGLPLESNGVAVIQCSGKTNVLNVTAVFGSFGIATYSVWDGDAGMGETEGLCTTCKRPLDKKPDPTQNHHLLRLHNASVVDFPPTLAGEAFTCFNVDLETTMKSEIGEKVYGETVDEMKLRFGLTKREQAIKNARVMGEVFREAKKRGGSSATVEALVRRIALLRGGELAVGCPQVTEPTISASAAKYESSAPSVSAPGAAPGSA
jgi:putative ATP-dependent endonuclease of OLD family